MSMFKSVSSAAIATAAALLFSTVTETTAFADEAKIHCDGVNSCKGQSVVVAPVGVKGQEVRIGVQAPKSVPVHREEVLERIQQEQRPGGRAPLAR